MRSSIAVTIRLSSLVALALAGCGDNLVPAGPEQPDGGPPSECQTLTVGQPEFHHNLFGQLTGLKYRVMPELGDSTMPDYLIVELYDSTTEGVPPLRTGTFDLAAAPNDDLATCQHCVWLRQDYSELEVPSTIFYASQGSMTLDQIDDPLSPVFVGRTSELIVRAATFDPETGHTEVIEGGACFSISPVSMDTRPTPGRACASAEDCGNALLEICDPASATCAPPQCGEFMGCPGPNSTCLTQYPNLQHGACYAVCDPTEDSCAAGQACIQFGVDPTYGVCRRIGDGAAGARCTVEDISTSCVAGLQCDEVSETCLPTCHYFADDTGCTAGNACYVLGGCRPESTGAPVEIGEPCGADRPLADGCGSDGEAFRGICFGYEPPLICERACLGDAGCGANEFCALRFDTGLGICRPIPVCGDGERGEINEICDDGNVVSGDGCSGDCQTVEYDVLCSGAEPLTLNATTSGTTLGGVDGFQTTCQFGLARGRLWTVTPPGRGRLRLHLESNSRHTVALRTDCDDSATEPSCRGARPGRPADLVFQVTSATPATLTALVTAGTVIDEGPFTLSTEFIPEQCGDGVVAGEEVCDDNNTTGNDGCSADCRTIEYDALCAAAPELSTTSPNAGDTTGGMPYFAASCSNTLFGSGPDRLYRFTAPAAGTLHLELVQQMGTQFTDLVLAVLDGCGASGSVPELACSSVTDPEQLSVTLAAGQEIMVLVEGFSEDGTGPYTLNATFTP